ncbi:MAG: hypothetical protein HUU30_14040 [Burkholderiaceae bacterium]|nr:hypothetical protein [Aquabacterium sp.]NUP86855.1 hypothetical protein [Burkholderiaceae bacterium]
MSNSKHLFRVAAVAAAATTSTGCAIVTSSPGTHGAVGVAYMLPRALLPVELTLDESGFNLDVKPPIHLGDPKHTYTLQRTGNIFTADNVVITADPATGLLSAVDVKSSDQSARALVTLASGLRGMRTEGGTAASAVVFSEHFDPGWADADVKRFNQRLQSAALAALDTVKRAQGCTASADADPCATTNRLTKQLHAQPLVISVDAAAPSEPVPADCSAGFCYRINVPHIVRVSGAGISLSDAFGLPNRSPTFVMPLERWAFVRTTHEVVLQGGVFQKVSTERPSSALAVAAVPFDIAKGAVTAAAEIIALKVDLSGKEKSLAEARVAEVEAKSKLDILRESKKPGGTDLPIGSSSQPGTAESAVPAARGLRLRVGPPARFDRVTGAPGTTGNPVESVGSGGVANGGKSAGGNDGKKEAGK